MIITNPAQTTQDLKAAEDAVRENGWTVGTYQNPVTGTLCAVGALMHAVGNDGSEDSECRISDAAAAVTPLLGLAETGPTALMRDLDGSLLYPVAALIWFNDSRCTGGDELADLFRQAREKLEAEL